MAGVIAKATIGGRSVAGEAGTQEAPARRGAGASAVSGAGRLPLASGAGLSDCRSVMLNPPPESRLRVDVSVRVGLRPGYDRAVHVRELFDLAGRTAIVTGGGSGLGRQMAHALAESGADLVLCARKVERCEETAAELEPTGVRVLTTACDVRVPEQVQAVVDRTVAELGGVDILVNNAGTSWGASPGGDAARRVGEGDRRQRDRARSSSRRPPGA